MAPKPNNSKEKLIQWASKSTIDAIPQIVTSKNWVIKILWICCLLGSTYLCGKTVYTNLRDYFSYPVDTVLEMGRDSDVIFPSVTICQLQICGLDGVDFSSFLNDTLKDLDASQNFSQNEPNMAAVFLKFKEDFLTNYDKIQLKNIFPGNNQSVSIKENLIACQYDGFDCDENDFEYFKLNEFQKCYTFNSGRNFNGNKIDIKKVRRFGKAYGLHTELYLGLPEDCKTPMSLNFGMILFIHNNTYSIWEENNGFEILAGYETDVAVDRTRLLKLPTPYSDCVLNTQPTLYDSNKDIADTFKATDSYTQQTCLQICYQKFLALKYNCSDSNLPFFRETNLKSCNKVVDSLENSVYTDKVAFYHEEYSNCLNKCPLECESYTYKATLSNSEFPSLTYAEFLEMRKNVSEEILRSENNIVGDDINLWRNGFVSFNVFYKSDLITKITERPQTQLEDFISGLGGTLGLFLGISFLSFIEFIEVLLEILMIKTEKILDMNKNVVGIAKETLADKSVNNV